MLQTFTDRLTTVQMNRIGMAYAKRWNARQRIAETLRVNPTALCPTPDELVDVESRGLVWNFETGKVEEINA
jgi:hypothetical protein